MGLGLYVQIIIKITKITEHAQEKEYEHGVSRKSRMKRWICTDDKQFPI